MLHLHVIVMTTRVPLWKWALSLALAALPTTLAAAECVRETPRSIPVAYQVDVVVAGGSSGAVEAACAAARKGASVFLLAPRPYLGDDICAPLRLWLAPGDEPRTKLARECFAPDNAATAWRVKAALDRALLEAGVPYLTGCCVTDALRDANGRLAGVVMANRSGRQAVLAKVIIDATQQAVVARQAGAAFRPFAPGARTVTRVVIGGTLQNGPGVDGRKLEHTCDVTSKKSVVRLPVYEYALCIDLPDDGFAAFARAEQEARDRTNATGVEAAAESLVGPTSAAAVGRRRLETWPGAARADLAAFRPQGVERLYVLSAAGDLSGAAAAKCNHPLELMELGSRLGEAAAAEARTLPSPQGARLPDVDVPDALPVAVGENLSGIRANSLGVIRSGQRTIPIWGRYDVVVVGGGTSGAPAGLAAAQSGAKTLVVEYLHELGGVGTVGLIAEYWYGLRRGFTRSVDRQVNPGQAAWNAVEKAEWLRRELRARGADVWFGALGCGALVDEGRVCGVVVATPHGRGAVLAGAVVDASGNADVAACAHAPTEYGVGERGSANTQIAGFPARPLRQSYLNTCYTLVDDADALDAWHLMAWKRTAGRESSSFDVGQLIDSRERHRVVGDYVLSVDDILTARTFPDTISEHYSNFDAAAFPDSRTLLAADGKGPCFRTDLPYRCLLPKGLDGLLVVGLGASVERDAMTLVRMQPDLQNQGYAAGLAAAAAAKLGGRTRRVDVKAIQKRLVAEDVLDNRVLSDGDSHPQSDVQIAHAVKTAANPDAPGALRALGLVMSHPQQAIPLLKPLCQGAGGGGNALHCAKILGLLGDPTGAPLLSAAIDAHPKWDQGMALTSQRKTGNMPSDLDRLVIALGFSGARAALPTLLAKLEQLRPESELSHYKALSLAFWDRNDRTAAAAPLAALLAQPGLTGHDTPYRGGQAPLPERLVTVATDAAANPGNLNRAMKEITVAALLYRCGDQNGQAAAILRRYLNDVHGHLVRYARHALERP